jgi:hypothetical protein
MACSQRVLASVLALAGVACSGGSSPGTTPTPVAPAVGAAYQFRAIDGLTGLPVEGASVTTDAASAVTDTAGVFTVTSPVARFRMTVQSIGHLTRTTLESGKRDVVMWPVRGDNSTTMVSQMVYSDDRFGPGGLRGLFRLTRGMSIVYHSDFPADKVAILQQAAATLQGYINLPVHVVTQAVPDTMGVGVAFDPACDCLAVVNLTVLRNVIQTGTLRFLSAEAVTPMVVLHELGHLAGLMHHDGTGLMNPFGSDIPAFTRGELDNLLMMYQSLPGTIFEHNDAGALVSPLLAGDPVSITSCRFGQRTRSSAGVSRPGSTP